MEKIVFVGGPTASGKTDLALAIAKKLNGELINADSRQVYKYMDVGTNKGNLTTINDQNYIDEIPIHLINFLEPNQRYSVYDFKTQALSKIEEILSKGKLPVIVGGTGLYMDSLIKDYPLVNNTNLILRSQLETRSLEELQSTLKDEYLSEYNKLNISDKNNKRRLVRLIEKLHSTGDTDNQFTANFDYIFIYPEYDWEELSRKIEDRVDYMFAHGLIEETTKVLALGYSKDSVALQGTGYKEVIQFIDGVISLPECIKLVKISHRQYAKRQRTWFEGQGRKYKLTKVKNADQTVEKVKKFYGYVSK